jgi:hypothetical protein
MSAVSISGLGAKQHASGRIRRGRMAHAILEIHVFGAVRIKYNNAHADLQDYSDHET